MSYAKPYSFEVEQRIYHTFTFFAMTYTSFNNVDDNNMKFFALSTGLVVETTLEQHVAMDCQNSIHHTEFLTCRKNKIARGVV